MRKLLRISMSLVLLAAPVLIASANDGTAEGAFSGPDTYGLKPGTTVRVTDDTYVISPFESVSINQTTTWQDNRHRAYYSTSLLNVNGFLLFDVTQIPDNAQIVSMTLRCYLENAFGSPAYEPYVDVYYSEDDGWTRSSATPGGLSLDVLLQGNVPFTSWIEYFDFELNVGAHDWSQDLVDNQICIGFTNDVYWYSYVYFFGAYGSPVGPAPELTIVTGTAMDVNVVLTPYGTPIVIPPSGGSFDFNIAVYNNEILTVWFDVWTDVTLPYPPGGSVGPIVGPRNLSLVGGGSINRDMTQYVPGTAPYGVYTYNAYVGDYPDVVWDSDSFTFDKPMPYDGSAAIGDWRCTGDFFEEIPEIAVPSEFAVLGNYPNPFNPSTTISFALPEAANVSLNVYDVSGSLVATLANGWRDAGLQEVTFDASRLASGLYIYQLTAGEFSATGKMVLMK